MERILQQKAPLASNNNDGAKGQKTLPAPQFKLENSDSLENVKNGNQPAQLKKTSGEGAGGETPLEKLNKILASKGFANEATAKEDFMASLSTADDAKLASYRADANLVNALHDALTDAEFAQVAANLILIAPSTCVDRPAARAAAISMLTVQLANKEIAKTTVLGKLTPVIIPRNLLLTDIAQFSALAGTTTFDGRPWEPTRGVGYGEFVAIAEENLLGGECTATFGGNPVNGTYDVGYSTATHEFAHGLHMNSLSAADTKIIEDAYNARKAKAALAPTDVEQWVDGREGSYASMTVYEFFAQLSNAYLGTNTGTDPYTNDARHNGKEWVRTNEPEVYALLEKLYAGGSVTGANPAVAAPAAPAAGK